jgi:hypothetical protein
VFEILFLAFAITALLRLPKDVRRMRECRRSVPSRPKYQIPGRAANRTPRRRKPTLEGEELSEIGSLSKWPSLRHANDNRRRL